MHLQPKPPTVKGPAETFTGEVQARGGEIVEIRSGDVVHTRPETSWGVQVTDAEYRHSP